MFREFSLVKKDASERKKLFENSVSTAQKVLNQSVDKFKSLLGMMQDED